MLDRIVICFVVAGILTFGFLESKEAKVYSEIFLGTATLVAVAGPKDDNQNHQC